MFKSKITKLSGFSFGDKVCGQTTKYRIDDDLGLDAKQETKDEITAALTYGVLED